jgi:hypothetical protein
MCAVSSFTVGNGAPRGDAKAAGERIWNALGQAPMSSKVPKRKPAGVASMTLDAENGVLSRILSRFTSLAAKWAGKRPMYQQTLIPQRY